MPAGAESYVVATKAAFQRPMVFNERILSDTFYVWDIEETKFAVTRSIDAFSLYQIATAAKDPSSDVSLELIRDRWVGVFGPPAVSDDRPRQGVQGSVGALPGHVWCPP